MENKLFENLKQYFENTPQEQLKKDWDEIKRWNLIGPDVLEYYEQNKKLIDMEKVNNKYFVLKKSINSDFKDLSDYIITYTDGRMNTFDDYDTANIKRIECMKDDKLNYYTVMKLCDISIMDITHQTMADGEGIRNTVYSAGCNHHCKNCHNPETWDIKNGKPTPIRTILQDLLSDKWCNVTFSGGDPLFQVDEFTELARLIKAYSNKTIWCYTGYTYEQIKSSPKLSQILPYIDILVDGPFVEKLKDRDLVFRGSSNQRIIDVRSGKDVTSEYGK